MVKTECLFNYEKDLPYGAFMLVTPVTDSKLNYEVYRKGKLPKTYTVNLSLDVFKQQMRGLGWYRI